MPNITEILGKLPEEHLLNTEELRSIVKSVFPGAKEKLVYGVLYYYLSK